MTEEKAESEEKLSPTRIAKKLIGKMSGSASLDSLFKDLYRKASEFSQEEFQDILRCFEEQYYNTEVSIPDEVYDKLVDMYTEKYGRYFKIGAAPSGKKKVKLPIFMGSLDKVKDEHKLNLWLKKSDTERFVLSRKVDGISSLLVIEKGVPKKLYTRGNGKVGQDISVLLKDINLREKPNIGEGGKGEARPGKGLDGSFMVRGEIIMFKDDFEPLKEKFANARNLSSGIVNSKTYEKEMVQKLHFIAYTLYDDSSDKPSKQFQKLEDMGFATPFIKRIKEQPTVESLTKLFGEERENAPYEMDGIVVGFDEYHDEPPDENPEYTVAFKTPSATKETKVLSVEWNSSKHGYLKPRIEIEPVTLSGATISWASGFNAKFIVDNKIGPGARVLIQRSGDVIPYITKVLEGADEPELPSDDRYHWNDTEVEFILDEEDDQTKIKKIHFFFQKLGMKSLGEKTVEKLYHRGLTTIGDFIRAEPDDLIGDKIGQTLADKIVHNIRAAITDVKLSTLMAASGEFGLGFGERKIEPILEAYPDILEYMEDTDVLDFPGAYSEDILVDMITDLKGYKKMAPLFVEGLPKFWRFLKDHPEIKVRTEAKKLKLSPKMTKLSGENVVFSGFRNQEWKDKIEAAGGKVTTTVSGKTTILVMKKTGTGTTKETKAKEQGIKIMSMEKFGERYAL